MPKRLPFEDKRFGELGLLSICVGISSTAFFANLPLVPLILRERDPAQLHLVGILIAVSFALSAALSPLWGYLADRFGARLMIQRSAIMVGLAYIGLALAPNVEYMFAARVLNGFASGLIPAAFTHVVKTQAVSVQGKAFTSLNAARASGAVLGPALALFTGLVDVTVIMIFIGLLAASSAVLAGFLKGDKHVASVAEATRRPASPKAKSRWYTGAPLIISLLGFSANGSGLQVALPLSLAKLDENASIALSGAMFGIAGAVTLLVARPWGKLIDNRGLRVSVGLATLGTAGALTALLILETFMAPGITAIMVLYILYCSFSSQVGAMISILNGQITGASGIGQGLQNSLLQAGAMIGPLVVGLFIPNLQEFYAVSLGIGLSSAVILFGVTIWHQRISGGNYR